VLSKTLNLIEKTFFTFVFFLLTDANNFKPFMNFLSRKPYIHYTVNFFTGVPINEAGKVFRFWWRESVSLSLNVAFWFILFMIIVRQGLFTRFFKALWNNAPVIGLLFIACASWFWSIAPNTTLDGIFLVVKITLMGIYISQIYSSEEILDLFIWVIALASVFSALALWKMPEQSIGPYGWHGIYSAKNYFGRLMAFGNVMLIVYWFKNGGAIFKQALLLSLFILTVVLLIYSDSATSLLTLAGMYGALIFYGLWTKWVAYFSARSRSIFLILGICLLILLALNYDSIFTLLNRSSTLTGRLPLWGILWTWFQKHPLFGFGYNAFWGQLTEPLLGWGRHAHNGYLEIALGLGITGLIFFLAALVIAWKGSFKLLRQKGQILFLWPILALMYFTFANLSYSIAFEKPDFHWLLFVIVSGLVTSIQPQALENPSIDKELYL
jgi:exopolysaccharide production protein ExoQ